jgi:hypothetical protein
MNSSSAARPESFLEALHRHTGGLCFGWVYLAALAVYLPTAAHTVQEADAGQFLALGATCLKSGWPLAHPPGYPIETAISCGSAWLAKVAAPIPAALWLAWASALFTALAAGLAYSALTRLKLASPFEAFVTVAVVFLSRDVWRVATTQEPLGLGVLTLTAAMFLPLLANQATDKSKSRWLWMLSGAAFGVGLANHHTTAIALPAALWGLWQAHRNQKAARPFFNFLIGAAIGALPVALIVIRSINPQEFTATSATGPVPAFEWVTAPSHGLPDLVLDPLRYLLRTEFGTFSLAQSKASLNSASDSALVLFFSDLPKNLGWFWIICAMHGAFALRRRAVLRIYFYFTLFTAMAFLLLNRFPADQNFIDIIRRFHPFVLITIMPFMAAGLADFMRLISQMAPASNQRMIKIFGLLLSGLVAGQALMTLADARRDLRTFPEQHFTGALNLLPPGALVVAASDEEIFGLSYAQVALGIRPDVRILNLLEWSNPAKRNHILARTGIDPNSLIDLNRGELIGMLGTREALWIIDAPLPPRPEYLAAAPCLGPYLILDLRKNPEIRHNQPVIPPQKSKPWFASDQSLLDKYTSCTNIQKRVLP